jgi:hypothetical protein
MPAISLPAAVLFLVKPKFHLFSFLAKSTISTTSPRRSSLTNFPSPSCTPVAGTPKPPFEPCRADSVSSRTADSEPPFYDSNHPQVCCELLNLFPHLSLAAGEPPRQVLIAAARLVLFKSIRDPNASLYFFLGSCLQNTCPSATHPSATRSSTTHQSATPLSATFTEEKSQPMRAQVVT